MYDSNRIYGCKYWGVIGVACALSACASTDYVSQLSRPGFGYRAFSVSSYDPSALMNGPYAPRYSDALCLPADYRCSPRAQLFSIESAPR